MNTNNHINKHPLRLFDFLPTVNVQWPNLNHVVTIYKGFRANSRVHNLALRSYATLICLDSHLAWSESRVQPQSAIGLLSERFGLTQMTVPLPKQCWKQWGNTHTSPLTAVFQCDTVQLFCTGCTNDKVQKIPPLFCMCMHTHTHIQAPPLLCTFDVSHCMTPKPVLLTHTFHPLMCFLPHWKTQTSLTCELSTHQWSLAQPGLCVWARPGPGGCQRPGSATTWRSPTEDESCPSCRRMPARSLLCQGVVYCIRS